MPIIIDDTDDVEVLVCESCGAENSVEARYCSGCGGWIEDDEELDEEVDGDSDGEDDEPEESSEEGA